MTPEAIGLTHPTLDQVQAALKLPNGARFYRCALQVNPFAYLRRYDKSTVFASEDEYNEAIVAACLRNRVEVIAVTDHYRVKDSKSLVCAARKAGIFAFGGFEAAAKDGVHFLCLFDPNKDKHLQNFIAECRISDDEQPSPLGCYHSIELLQRSKEWEAVCIAAHVASESGLLKQLSGQPRIDVWRCPDLLACALPGPVSAAPPEFRPILENTNVSYRRDRRLAVLNASDVNAPEDLEKTSTSCFIKMSIVSVEALRQAFLDPESRIRLHTDPIPESHAEFLAMTWEGGFLHDTDVHFNGNLNVLVGGRGAGKSTIIESIRYVLGLDPLGEQACKIHESIVRQVLQSGTKISLLVRSHKPSARHYTIERTVPNPPVVKDENGELSILSPHDVIPGVEVFGQHEISELAKSPEKLTLLLRRFAVSDPSLSARESKVRRDLQHSRSRIVDVRSELKQIEERLAELPVLEEKQKRFQSAGLEEHLKEKSLLIREERIFSSLEERLNQYGLLQNDLAENLPIDMAFVSDKALEGLPNSDILAEMERILAMLNTSLNAANEQFDKALSATDRLIQEIKSRWNERHAAIEKAYENILRELQRSKIDGAEFIRLRRRIEELRPLQERMHHLKRDSEAHEAQRRKLLEEWKDIKETKYQQIATAAKRVSKQLKDSIRVKAVKEGNREPLKQLLREVNGIRTAAMDRLLSQDHLSLPELAQCCWQGKESLIRHYNLPSGSAERLAQAGTDLFMRIEELDLPTTTEIELNIATSGKSPEWKTLQALSTGQKATAVLLLLLLESEAPLVIDQPEDDLDNRFVTEGVVPTMRKEKQRRQFIFSTHNANIPVLGDAELIFGLAAADEAGEVRTKIENKYMGSLDSPPVRELIEEILEGGRAAFEMRRTKYGF